MSHWNDKKKKVLEQEGLLSTEEEITYSEQMTDIAAELFNYRISRDLTAEDLGDMIGKSVDFVNALESAEIYLSVKDMIEISEALGGEYKMTLGLPSSEKDKTQMELFFGNFTIEELRMFNILFNKGINGILGKYESKEVDEELTQFSMFLNMCIREKECRDD